MWLLKATSGSFKVEPELMFEKQPNWYFQVSSGCISKPF